jgi:uncharacterized protein YjbI with pentapeptide repeats
LLKCKFTTQYFDYETDYSVDFNCPEEELLPSGFCIFHDKDYLQDKTNTKEHKRAVLDRLKRKVNHAISNNQPLLCIGFQLPEFSLSGLSISKEFTKPVYFNDSLFFGKADFSGTKFHGEAYFGDANFQGEANFSMTNFQGKSNFGANFQGGAYFFGAEFQGVANFSEANFQGGTKFYDVTFQGETLFYNSEFYGKTYFSGKFNGETKFNYVLFEGKEKIYFDIDNLSNVSFMNTDLTEVRFSDEARWGGKKAKEDRFKTVDERLLEEKIKEKDDYTTKYLNLGSIKAVYRSLRENYEYRMRYDEAGQFFIREMELKRKYREVVSPKDGSFKVKVKQNNWFRRNLLSLTGWYYHLSRYEESLWRPTLAGLAIIILSTLFWSTQENPELKPWLPIFQDDDTGNVTKFVGFDKFGDGDHWLKAFERSIAGFIPLLPLESGIKVGIMDYVIKIVGGAVVFALIAVALRRRFERRYRH